MHPSPIANWLCSTKYSFQQEQRQQSIQLWVGDEQGSPKYSLNPVFVAIYSWCCLAKEYVRAIIIVCVIAAAAAATTTMTTVEFAV